MTGSYQPLPPIPQMAPEINHQQKSPQVPLILWLAPPTPPCTMLKIPRPHWPTHPICREMAIKLRLNQGDPCQDPSVIIFFSSHTSSCQTVGLGNQVFSAALTCERGPSALGRFGYAHEKKFRCVIG